jgi:NAD(P)-dependent dehydrogenase (short-subunit alcohol dehydrogenase family)
MLLDNKSAVIYEGGGSIGGAVARALAREGTRVVLAGRTVRRPGHPASLHDRPGRLPDAPHPHARRLRGRPQADQPAGREPHAAPVGEDTPPSDQDMERMQAAIQAHGCERLE